MNEGQYLVISVGADGSYSLYLRLIEASDHFLESQEYKRVVKVLPPVAIRVENKQVFFGAAESVEVGGGLCVENGRCTCSVASLRSGRNLQFIATLIRSDDNIPEVYQFPEFREV